MKKKREGEYSAVQEQAKKVARIVQQCPHKDVVPSIVHTKDTVVSELSPRHLASNLSQCTTMVPHASITEHAMLITQLSQDLLQKKPSPDASTIKDSVTDKDEGMFADDDNLYNTPLRDNV